MKAIIITIGDELLIGQVINTNAAFISERLNSVGIQIGRVLTVGDAQAEILASFRENFDRYDVIVVTGGLGPTHDDITKKAVCAFFQTDLVPSDEAREKIRTFLKLRDRPWSDAAEEQTLVPRGSIVIPNNHGTASGILFERPGKYFICMPGVPYEMEGMINEFILPYFSGKSTGDVVLHRTLKTSGIAESTLSNRLGNIDEIIGNGTLAFLPSPSGVRMRISVVNANRAAGERLLREIESRIRAKVGETIYGSDDEELEEVAGRLLAERGLKLALAESCTGGMIAHHMTNVPGSSAYFERAVVVYSNQSKIDSIGVPGELIERHGAVSREVAEAMAEGIRTVAGTDIGISTTGIAGPSGGTPRKPVGLVWIGYSDRSRTFSRKYQFGGHRTRVKEQATRAALELLRRTLLGID
jgi:nicotinamide-nucleotide amidase